MEVTVKYLGFQKIEGLQKTTMDLPEGSTLGDLMMKIKESRNDEEIEILDRATVLVNKKKGDVEIPLSDGDYVLILAPLGGG